MHIAFLEGGPRSGFHTGNNSRNNYLRGKAGMRHILNHKVNHYIPLNFVCVNGLQNKKIRTRIYV